MADIHWLNSEIDLESHDCFQNDLSNIALGSFADEL